MTAKPDAGSYVLCGCIRVMRVDWEMQFDWIEGRFVSCWRLLHG